MTPTKILVDSLNCRAVPGLNTSVLTVLRAGNPVTLIDGLTDSAAGYDWQAVELATKQLGWIAKVINGKPTYGDVPPPPPPVPKRTKIGLHIVQGGSNDTYKAFAADLRANATPLAGATIINQPDLANQMVDMVSGPVVYRFDPNGNDVPQWDTFGNSYASFYNAGVQWVDQRYQNYTVLDRRIYWQMTNEPGWHALDYAFWRGVMDHVRGWGYNAAIFADATGNPSGADWLDKWKGRIPALQQAKHDGHIVVYHAYSAVGTPAGQVSNAKDLPYNEMRFKPAWDTLPADARANVVIGEAASEHAEGRFQGAQECVNFAMALNDLVADLSYVLALNLWTAGPWKQSSIDSALPLLGSAIKARK